MLILVFDLVRRLVADPTTIGRRDMPSNLLHLPKRNLILVVVVITLYDFECNHLLKLPTLDDFLVSFLSLSNGSTTTGVAQTLVRGNRRAIKYLDSRPQDPPK